MIKYNWNKKAISYLYNKNEFIGLFVRDRNPNYGMYLLQILQAYILLSIKGFSQMDGSKNEKFLGMFGSLQSTLWLFT